MLKYEFDMLKYKRKNGRVFSHKSEKLAKCNLCVEIGRKMQYSTAVAGEGRATEDSGGRKAVPGRE